MIQKNIVYKMQRFPGMKRLNCAGVKALPQPLKIEPSRRNLHLERRISFGTAPGAGQVRVLPVPGLGSCRGGESLSSGRKDLRRARRDCAEAAVARGVREETAGTEGRKEGGARGALESRGRV